jgi:hypothetical protein
VHVHEQRTDVIVDHQRGYTGAEWRERDAVEVGPRHGSNRLYRLVSPF